MCMGHNKIKVIGIDLSKDGDVSVFTEGYYKDGVFYAIKSEIIKEGESK